MSFVVSLDVAEDGKAYTQSVDLATFVSHTSVTTISPESIAAEIDFDENYDLYIHDEQRMLDKQDVREHIAVSPCGQFLVRSISNESPAMILNPITTSVIRSLRVGALRELVFSPDGKYLLGIKDVPNNYIGISTLIMFSLPSFTVVATAHGKDYKSLKRPEFTPNSSLILVSRFDTGRVYILSVPYLKNVRQIDTTCTRLLGCTCLNDQLFVPCHYEVERFSVWNYKTSGLVKTIEISQSAPAAIVVSPDRSKFACTLEDGRLLLYNLESMELISDEDYGSFINTIVFIDNERAIIDQVNKRLKIVELSERKTIKAFCQKRRTLRQLAFFRDPGKMMI